MSFTRHILSSSSISLFLKFPVYSGYFRSIRFNLTKGPSVPLLGFIQLYVLMKSLPQPSGHSPTILHSFFLESLKRLESWEKNRLVEHRDHETFVYEPSLGLIL